MQNETTFEAVDYPHPFDEAAARLCQSTRRYVAILSPELDPAAFDCEALADALRKLLTESAQSEVRILIRNPAAMLGRGHRLLYLARRLPSRIHVRRLREHPDWKDETVMIFDRDAVLFKPAGSLDRAFWEQEAPASAQQRLELFDSLWRYAEEDPDIRGLSV
ncbi:hypothetical protein [Haliea sp. E17]|uniref:DUF7931 domain-containing protein n=1 Tax=Haliea sp. E17 TaxID=3401576 RepID=UPI003AABCF57